MNRNAWIRQFHRWTSIVFVLCGFGVVLLTHTGSVPLLFVGALLVGLGLGAEGDIAAYVVSRYIPKLTFSRVFGIVMFLYAQGGAVGIFILSYSFSHTGSYDSAVWVIVAMVALAAVAMLLLGRYRYRVDGSPATADALVEKTTTRE